MKFPAHIFLFILISLVSCDRARLYEDYKTIPDSRWYYKNKYAFDIQVKEPAISYNVFVNLRIDAEYRYSNIFLWLHTFDPARKAEKTRVEIRLADERGKWLGNGLGDIFDYQIPVARKVRFPVAGFYRFEIEQNMRDDTLAHVKAIGIRIEKAE